MSTLYKRESNPYWHWSSVLKGRRLRKSTGMRQKHLAIQVQSKWDMMQFNGDLSFVDDSYAKNGNIDAFMGEYLNVRSRVSRNTKNTSQAVIKKFKSYLNSIGITSILDVSLDILDGYIDFLDCSAKTKKNHIIELKQLFDKAVVEGIIPANLVPHVTLPRIVKEDRHRTLNAADLRCIMDNAGAWKLFYEFLYRTGLRTGDVAMLKYENINFSKNAIVKMVRKSRRIHEFPISDVLLSMIDSKDCKGPIFPELYTENEVKP